MHPIEIIVIVLASFFFAWFVSSNIHRLIKGKPMVGSDCCCCGNKGKKLIKSYRKAYKSNNAER